MLFQKRENTWLTKQSNSIVLRFQSPQANFYEFQVNFTVRQRNIGNTRGIRNADCFRATLKACDHS